MRLTEDTQHAMHEMRNECHQRKPIFPSDGAPAPICCNKPQPSHNSTYRNGSDAENVHGPAGRVAHEAWFLHGDGFWRRRGTHSEDLLDIVPRWW